MSGILDDIAFGVVTLTASFNSQPYVPGQLGALGIFEEEGVPTTIIEVEENNGSLSLVEPSPRGGVGQTSGDDGRKKRTFAIDHFEINDTIKADEVQNVKSFGTDDELETLQGRIDKKLKKHGFTFDNTLEHNRVGAVKGLVTSKNGVILHNLYNDFEIAVPAAVEIALNTEVADLGARLKDDVVLSIEDALDGSYTGLHAMCGRDYHTKMWNQKQVRETYLNHSGAPALRGGTPDKFEYEGITHERYRTGRKAREGHNGVDYIAPNEARVFPVGVPDLFVTYFAPADLEETVNTDGLPRYAHQYAMANGKGRHLDVQMNAISLCTQPGVLRKLVIAP